jgi:PST family polysaccharide transporter
MVTKIIDKFRRVIKLDIVRVFSFTSVSTLVKMIAGFVSVKVVAVIIGPSGVALVGQLNNFSAIIMAVATGGITTGVTKYIAEYKNDTDLIRGYTSTAVKIVLFFSLLCGLFLVLGAQILSSRILLDVKYSFVFTVFGVTLIFYAANTLLLAVINGYKQFNLYVKASIVSSIIGLVLSLLLVISFGVNGALLNAVTSQSLVFFVVLFLVKKANIGCLEKAYLWNKFDKAKAVRFFRFALMTLVSAFTVPVSQLIIRNYIINRYSLETAGLWEGMNRLSNVYLMIITSSFGVYYLPRLSELRTDIEIKKEIQTAYKVIVPCMAAGLTAIYFGRFLIIDILFADDFREMSGLFFWHLVGDFLKIASWLIAYLLHAKSMTRLFIATEIFFTASYVGLAIFSSELIGLNGVVLGYAINYFVYFFAMYFLIYKRINNVNINCQNT